MADFFITGVQYDEANSHIKLLEVREKIIREEETKMGAPHAVPRAFVASLIRLNKVSFQTVTKRGEEWRLGADVLLHDGKFLTTERNRTKRDNLGELPVF